MPISKISERNEGIFRSVGARIIAFESKVMRLSRRRYSYQGSETMRISDIAMRLYGLFTNGAKTNYLEGFDSFGACNGSSKSIRVMATE